MSLEELTAEVASLKLIVAELQRKILDMGGRSESSWLPHDLCKFADNPDFDEATAYGGYYRVTGRDAPPDWKPGDPIPEPDHWK